MWGTYEEHRFKETFRVTRATFTFILENVRPIIQKDSLVEDPVSPELRLAVCLYRLGRGDALYTISELTALGHSTVCTIVIEVCESLISSMWASSVTNHFPSTREDCIKSATDMESQWQFPYAFSAVDGCHLPIKCPPGGKESNKEYHNFKEFYSIVLMALVDADYRFIWASSGIPGNTHDSMIFQSTDLYNRIVSGKTLIDSGFIEGGVRLDPIILGNSAFGVKPWLMKPFTNAVLSTDQKYFNYRLSRARMIVESAFGQLKGRWRVFLKKWDSSVDTVKLMSLACVVLHNGCVELQDKPQKTWDMTRDPTSNKLRSREDFRDLLLMRSCSPITSRNRVAENIRNKLMNKFQRVL